MISSEQLILLPRLLLRNLDRTLIALHFLKALSIRHQLRIPREIDSHTRGALARHKGETHQDISSSDVLAAKKFTSIRGRSELLFEETEVRFEVGREVEAFHLADDGACDRLDEEGDFGAGEHCVALVCVPL